MRSKRLAAAKMEAEAEDGPKPKAKNPGQKQKSGLEREHAPERERQRADQRAEECQPERKCQTACKPGSVRVMTTRDDHSSGTRLAARLTRPTRAAGRECPCILAG
jgi:hypothetical protein